MKLYRFSPILSDKDMFDAINYVHSSSNQLCNKVMGEYLPNLGNLVIFCHYDKEYEYLSQKLKELTTENKNIDGKYHLLKSPITIPSSDGIPGSTINYLYIRQPDPWRSQVGDLDVYMEPEEYKKLKQELSDGRSKSGMRIFPRGDLDMIELYDPDIDALTYVRPVKLDL